MIDKDMDYAMKLWEISAENARHFNEMATKSRQLGLSLSVAIFGLSGALLVNSNDQRMNFEFLNYSLTLHLSTFLILLSAGSVYIVKTLDIYIYHRMLRGTVAFGEDVENYLQENLIDFEKYMMQSISHFSRFSDAKVQKCEKTHRYVYYGSKKVTASQKLEKFYLRIIVSILLSALFVGVTTTDVKKIEITEELQLHQLRLQTDQ